MTLCELIKKFEAGEVEDADFEHPLAREIVEELAQCRESDVQRALFDDARQLADHIVEQYLRLDREDKLKMAEAYQNEECFKNVGGVPHPTQKRLIQQLGKSNFQLLFRISNYSKFIPILENYMRFITENEAVLDMNIPKLGNYLCRHSADGKKVGLNRTKSLKFLYDYNFRKGCLFKKGEVTPLLLESMTFGVPADFRQRVVDCQSSLKARTRILENYVAYIDENYADLDVKASMLGRYLNNHDINGKAAAYRSKSSLLAFYQHDFRTGRTFKRGAFDPASLIESMTLGISEDLKHRVIDAQLLVKLRTRILENYVRYVKGHMADLSVKTTGLYGYLSRRNVKGKEVKYGSSESLNSFYTYDFRNGRSFKRGERNPESVFASMTFRVKDAELVEKVRRYALAA